MNKGKVVFYSFLGGMWVGIVALVLIESLHEDGRFKQLNNLKELITECEKNLPRNVSCTLVAKPKEEGNNG